MATEDIQIVAAGVAATPLDYLIPGAGQIQPKAITATYDGTGAATPFLPIVEVISDGGVVVARCPAPTVAAGGSADISWFPHVARAQQTLVGARIQAPNSQSVANETNTNLVYQTVLFDTDGMADLATNNRILTVNTAGIYLVVAETMWVYGHNGAGRRINTVVHNDYYTSMAIPDVDFSLDDRPANWAPVGGDGSGGPRTTNSSTGLFYAVPGDFFSSGAYHAAGGFLNCNGHDNCFLSALLVGT